MYKPMKTILTIAAIFITLNCFSQTVHIDTIQTTVVYDLGDGFVEKLDTLENVWEIRVIERTDLSISPSSVAVEFNLLDREVFFYLPDSTKYFLNPNRIVKFIEP